MLFKFSDIVVINKIDLIDVMDLNVEEMIEDGLKINPNLKIFTTSATTDENISELINVILD